MDLSATQIIAGAAGILATIGLIGLGRRINNLKANKEGGIHPVHLELVPPVDQNKEFRQMAEMFRLGVRPENIAKLFGIGRRR